MVHFNTGPRRWDPVAVNEGSCLPHEGVNAMGGAALGRGQISARNTERYFVTGNERIPFRYYSPAAKGQPATAYHLDAADRFFYLVELMNMNMNDATVYITMTYDITEGALPAGWQDVKTVFLDANSCRSSEVPSPKGKTEFSIQSKPWRPNVEGRIIDSMGHLHDGGIDIAIQATQGNALCKATAVYSSKPEYVYRDTGMAMHGDKVAKDHISEMAGCGANDIKIQKMSKDQTWYTKGVYDYNKRAANLEGGAPSEVMAIAIVIVAVPPGTLIVSGLKLKGIRNTDALSRPLEASLEIQLRAESDEPFCMIILETSMKVLDTKLKCHFAKTCWCIARRYLLDGFFEKSCRTYSESSIRYSIERQRRSLPHTMLLVDVNRC
jgi:hypothetical protein